LASPSAEFAQLVALLRGPEPQAASPSAANDLVEFRGQLISLSELRRRGYIR
jgi:hypothetical protein